MNSIYYRRMIKLTTFETLFIHLLKYKIADINIFRIINHFKMKILKNVVGISEVKFIVYHALLSLTELTV